MLSGTTPLKQNYTVDNSSPFVDEPSTRFKLRDYVKDPIEYALLTTLPTEEALHKLRSLNQFTQKHIFNILKLIYSHVTERTPSEDRESFFIHVAATVYYEECTNINIKNKEHYKKAASLVKMLENSIKEDKKVHLRMATTDEQKNVIHMFYKIFEAHLNATNRALSVISDKKKKHLETHQNMHTLPVPSVLSPQKVAAVQSSYPSTLFDKTPKKLSREDKGSISFIKSSIQNFELSSDEEEDEQDSIILFSSKKPGLKSISSANPLPRPVFNSIMDELDFLVDQNEKSKKTDLDISSTSSQDNYTSDSDSSPIHFLAKPKK